MSIDRQNQQNNPNQDNELFMNNNFYGYEQNYSNNNNNALGNSSGILNNFNYQPSYNNLNNNFNFLERQNSNLYFGDNNNLYLQTNDNLELFSYQYQVNNEQSSLDDFEQQFGVEYEDQGQNYQEQHMMKQHSNRIFQYPNLTFIPPNQNIGHMQEKPVNIVLTNENNNVSYAFDQVPLLITEDKKYDINQLIEMKFINAYIDDSCIITIKKSHMNIYLGKHPITQNRYQSIDNGVIEILFKSDNCYENNFTNMKSVNQNNNEQDDDKRVEERTIKEALQHVKLWRDTYKEAKERKPKDYLNITLDTIANEAKNCKKKTLDYYYLELRKAESYGFDFSDKLHEKMGMLRQFNNEQERINGTRKPKKEIEYQLPEEHVLPIDEEFIERLIKNARPSSKILRQKQQGLSNQNIQNEDENNDENGSKNNFEPLPKQKQITKSKSGSPKTNSRLEKPSRSFTNQSILSREQSAEDGEEEEEESKFDGSNKQSQHNYIQYSNTNTQIYHEQEQQQQQQYQLYHNQEQEIQGNPQKHNQRFESNIDDFQDENRNQFTMNQSINPLTDDIFNSVKKENTDITFETTSTFFKQPVQESHHDINLLNSQQQQESLYCKNDSNIEDIKLFNDPQHSMSILPPFNQIQSIDLSNTNFQPHQ